MRLLPREHQRLQVFLAAELARRRRARGLRLAQAEAVAMITDEVMEAARDGLAYAEVEQRGYEMLAPRTCSTRRLGWSRGSSWKRCSPMATA